MSVSPNIVDIFYYCDEIMYTLMIEKISDIFFLDGINCCACWLVCMWNSAGEIMQNIQKVQSVITQSNMSWYTA